MTGHSRPLGAGASPDQLADALVRAAATARWPDGSLLLDLDENVVRNLLAPHLATALALQSALPPPSPSALPDHERAGPPYRTHAHPHPLEPPC